MTKPPTQHLEKLTATLANDKLPAEDRRRLEVAIERYHQWIDALSHVSGSGPERVRQMVKLLDEYKLFIDVDTIFDSPRDFLYRQKGQLKLDNSILEEFLPHLVSESTVPELAGASAITGPASSFSSAFFLSSLDAPQLGGGIKIRTKDQDFAISKPLYVRASHDPGFAPSTVAVRETRLAYLAVECKTNLDKTMFQEACASAHDVKSAVSGAKYFLLCEWLDMTPLSTAPTDIDEVIILRKAKRLNSGIRKHFDLAEKRQQHRNVYFQYLQLNAFAPEMFQRFIDHVRQLLKSDVPVERDVLQLGYF